jgi:hypothetical protein
VARLLGVTIRSLWAPGLTLLVLSACHQAKKHSCDPIPKPPLGPALDARSVPEPPLRTLAGMVGDSATNRGLPGTTVSLPVQKRAVLTDAEGRFSIPDLPKGFHDIAVRRVGYRPIHDKVRVSDSAGVTRLYSLAYSDVVLCDVMFTQTIGSLQ